MREIVRGVFVSAALMAFALGMVAGKTPRPDRPAAAPQWQISGLWTETCGCKPTCPCWFNKRPTGDHCENVQVFRIDKGHYGSVPLAHVIVVLAWVTPPGPMTMDQDAAHSRVLAYYLDQSTTRDQREAVANIWNSSIMAGIHGAQGGAKVVSFRDVDFQPGGVTLSIPGILTYRIQRWKNRPVTLADPTHVRSGFQQGSSRDFRYSDYGVHVHYSGRHAFFAHFEAHS
jgi:hypothetical protein